ncbi:hypothetical protein VNO77_29460 [Canavalia gladiata]|uniref:Uncharacterized protein n=1 Tax=Canavalia gladiata TaxID=3824 RepID=A0AAN9KWQ7_CANGL
MQRKEGNEYLGFEASIEWHVDIDGRKKSRWNSGKMKVKIVGPGSPVMPSHCYQSSAMIENAPQMFKAPFTLGWGPGLPRALAALPTWSVVIMEAIMLVSFAVLVERHRIVVLNTFLPTFGKSVKILQLGALGIPTSLVHEIGDNKRENVR